MDYFHSNGLRLAYTDIPTGNTTNPPIILIHGFASNHFTNWVAPSWTRTLNEHGFRVIAFDVRGHGLSDKPHDSAAYHSSYFCDDIQNLLNHMEIPNADVMGYSMGARIAALFASKHPERTRSLLLGGIGINLLQTSLLSEDIAQALEVSDSSVLTDSTQRMFRTFAERTKSDLTALASCIRGFKQTITTEELRSLPMPALISAGSRDHIAASAQELTHIIKHAKFLNIPDRDHNTSVGDKHHKQGVIDFLSTRQ